MKPAKLRRPPGPHDEAPPPARRTGYSVVVETAKAYTLGNAQDLTNTLRQHLPVVLGNSSPNLAVVLTVTAPSIPAAVAIATHAVEELAETEVRAIEAAQTGDHLARAED